MPLAHARSLRRGRFSEAGRIYLITTCIRRRRPIFKSFFLGREVVKSLRTEGPRAETLCFVVMPDHLHWLLQLQDGANLSAVVRNVKAGSSRRIRALTGDDQPIWQSGFHDHALRKDQDVVDVARYVITNPLRAGLVERLADYPLWDAAWL
jgi:putative transposase